MFPKFFKHKMREVGAFFKIMRGKATQDDSLRKEGVDDALNAMKDEKSVYQGEKQEASRGIDTDTHRYEEEAQEKVLRESGGQDISAI